MINYTEYLDNFDFMQWCDIHFKPAFRLGPKIKAYSRRHVDGVMPKAIAKEMSLKPGAVSFQIRSFKESVDEYVCHLNNRPYVRENNGHKSAPWRTFTDEYIATLPTTYQTATIGHYYFTGKLCVNGHVAVRRRSKETGQCVICQAEATEESNQTRSISRRRKKLGKVIYVFNMPVFLNE